MKTKLKKLYEGKAKIIYQKNTKEVHAYYKNDATAFNNLKKKDPSKIKARLIMLSALIFMKF